MTSYPYIITSSLKLTNEAPASVLETSSTDPDTRRTTYYSHGTSAEPVKELDIHRKGLKVGELRPAAKPNRRVNGLSDPMSLVPQVGFSLEEPVQSCLESHGFGDLVNQGDPEIDCPLNGLMRGDVGSIIATGGAGKGMLLLQESCKLALGKASLLTRETKPRRVCYLSLEDSIVKLQKRVSTLASFEKFDPLQLQGLNARFKLMYCRKLDVASKEGPRPEAVLELFTEGTKPDILIIDTARRLHKLEENSATDMSILMESLEDIAEKLQCVVLLVHHSSKGATFAAAQGAEVGAGAARGSSALSDNGRGSWLMTVMSSKVAKEFNVQEEDRKSYVALEQTKCNLDRGMDPVWLKRRVDGFFETVTLTQTGQGKGGKSSGGLLK